MSVVLTSFVSAFSSLSLLSAFPLCAACRFTVTSSVVLNTYPSLVFLVLFCRATMPVLVDCHCRLVSFVVFGFLRSGTCPVRANFSHLYNMRLTSFSNDLYFRLCYSNPNGYAYQGLRTRLFSPMPSRNSAISLRCVGPIAMNEGSRS